MSWARLLKRVFEIDMEHSVADRDAMVSVASGWHTHVGLLIDILNGHELSGFWLTHARLKDEYEKRIAPR